MLARLDSALLRYGLIGEYLRLKQFDRAIEHLRKALQHDLRYSAAWKLLGEALTEAGNTDAAIRAYEDGIHSRGKRRQTNGQGDGGISETVTEVTSNLRYLP